MNAKGGANDIYRCLACNTRFTFQRPQKVGDPLPTCTLCGHKYVHFINHEIEIGGKG